MLKFLQVCDKTQERWRVLVFKLTGEFCLHSVFITAWLNPELLYYYLCQSVVPKNLQLFLHQQAYNYEQKLAKICWQMSTGQTTWVDIVTTKAEMEQKETEHFLSSYPNLWKPMPVET